MCGICFILYGVVDIEKQCLADQALHNRGPDVHKKLTFSVAPDLQGHMLGYVLHLRGSLTPQPLTDQYGNSLLWNGEIFGGVQVADFENDSFVLIKTLGACSCSQQILSVFQSIQGPWAFVYWQAPQRTIWFGRDLFGRRSLLWKMPSQKNSTFMITSVAFGEEVFSEVPALGIYSITFPEEKADYESQGSSQNLLCEPSLSHQLHPCLPEPTLEENIVNIEQTLSPLLTIYPWQTCVWPGTNDLVIDLPYEQLLERLFPNEPAPFRLSIDKSGILTKGIPHLNDKVFLEEKLGLLTDKSFEETSKEIKSEWQNDSAPEKILHERLRKDCELDRLSDTLIKVLEEAVRLRVCNIPIDPKREPPNASSSPESTTGANIAILFSGGLDSTVLAALADRCLPQDEEIDLLNVAFEQPVRKYPHQKNQKKPKHNGTNKKTTTISNKNSCDQVVNCIEDLNLQHSSAQNIIEGDNQGLDSVEDYSALDTEHIENSSERTLLKSKSSGVGTMLDHTQSSKGCLFQEITLPLHNSFDVPDRLTGRLALSELNPRRKWNFIEINVAHNELVEARRDHVRRLLHPLCTVLDDSIGCAVWFAARGRGIIRQRGKGHHLNQSHDQDHTMGRPIVSKSRVLLCGMAADEQFAGYSRHRVTYKAKGYAGLVESLQEEINRISTRNLGRDDRIISDHGKESRLPFLDESVIQFVSSIPIQKKADLDLPRGIGEKLLLRLAALKLGLPQTACQPKRAIQFGSKIAKLDNSKEKGSDVCGRLS